MLVHQSIASGDTLVFGVQNSFGGTGAGRLRLTIEAEIARCLYDEIRDKALKNKAVRLSVRMEEHQRRWPGASRDQIIRACLIAYEMLIQDVAESIATVSGKRTALPDLTRKIDDGDSES